MGRPAVVVRCGSEEAMPWLPADGHDSTQKEETENKPLTLCLCHRKRHRRAKRSRRVASDPSTSANQVKRMPGSPPRQQQQGMPR